MIELVHLGLFAYLSLQKAKNFYSHRRYYTEQARVIQNNFIVHRQKLVPYPCINGHECRFTIYTIVLPIVASI